MGIDLGVEPVPDATAMLKFRRLLGQHKLGEQLFAKVSEVLQASGCWRRHETEQVQPGTPMLR